MSLMLPLPSADRDRDTGPDEARLRGLEHRDLTDTRVTSANGARNLPNPPVGTNPDADGSESRRGPFGLARRAPHGLT
jgi:hypothetical protein